MQRLTAQPVGYQGEVMDINKLQMKPSASDLPVYSLREAAQLLNVHPQTLRKYQAAGLVRPIRQGSRWLFSQKDVMWTECLRSMIHTKKLSIPGLRKLLQLVPCWMAASCPVEIQCHCPAQVDWSLPRRLQLVGGRSAARDNEAAGQTDGPDQMPCGA
ncbi:MAG: MerR family transcriptional regulator [Thermodesulfobacteriota bacterium]